MTRCQQSSRRRSEARRAASLANGAKSRGPVTPEGKAASARNALKHGFDAVRFAAADDVDAQAFSALLGALEKRFVPEGEVEERLVRQLARVMLRIERVEHWEADVLASGGGLFRQEAGFGRTFPVGRFYQ